MKSMIEELEEMGISFSLQYYGINDYSTLWDVRVVLENQEYFLKQLSHINLGEIERISEYLDYLLLQKLIMFREINFAIKSDKDKCAIENISELANEKCEQIRNGYVIKYINCSYKEIFSEKYSKYYLPQVALDIIIKFQSGIKDDVFEYLAQNYNYLLINKFQDLRKKFESSPQLFKMLFPQRNLEEIRALRFNSIFPIFISIINSTNENLKEITFAIVENIIRDVENYFVNDIDSKNIIIVERDFNQIFDFIKQIKHPKANFFQEYSRRIEEKLEIYLKENGKKFSYEIPSSLILMHLKELPNWKIKMLSLTHDFKSENNICESRLARFSCKKSVRESISYTTITDEYFTISHQMSLQLSLDIGAGTILAMWHDEELFPDCLEWYINFLNFISERMGNIDNLSDDIEMLYVMLEPVILSHEKDKNMLAPLCYGAAMFICALTEKLLRTLYIYLAKDKVYIPLTVATLGALLTPNNQELVNIFGEDHLKNISFFFCSVGEKKIGKNYRNLLAHWVELKSRDLNCILVAELFYLYTDIINSIFWHFYSLEENCVENKDVT